MNYYVGIDLGTSSVKTLLLSGDGEVVSSVTKEYPLYFPHNGWSEQNPEDWYNQTVASLKELLKDIDTKKIESKLTSQYDLFLKNTDNYTIGITGTKGKSTTSSLLYKIIKDQNDNVILAGNIGIPILAELENCSNFACNSLGTPMFYILMFNYLI
mgnify:CR=1 FL=1